MTDEQQGLKAFLDLARETYEASEQPGPEGTMAGLSRMMPQLRESLPGAYARLEAVERNLIEAGVAFENDPHEAFNLVQRALEILNGEADPVQQWN